MEFASIPSLKTCLRTNRVLFAFTLEEPLAISSPKTLNLQRWDLTDKAFRT